MKESKQAKASGREDEADMISKLPDDVLQLILSCLEGTEEAIRTSIFSRRWRYLWTSLPSIDIDYLRGWNPSQEFKRNEFKEFVDWVLAKTSFSLDLDSFRLQCANVYNMSTIGPWIDAAVMRKVKLLDLMFLATEKSDVDYIELPHSLVTCSSLEVLRLCLVRLPLILPNITGFPALKVLELNEVELHNSNIVKYFLESCPLLEDLSLIDCCADSHVISCPKLKNLRIYAQEKCDSLEICCPKLEFLKLTGFVAEKFLFESLYSLKKVVIELQDISEVQEQPHPLDSFDKISHVEYLSINVYYITECFNPSVDAPVSFPNLKTLEILTDYDQISGVIPFLKCVPDLVSLHLIISTYNDGWEFDLEEAATINILTVHLKKVEFIVFDDAKLQLDLARDLLEHGNFLEEMVFSWGNKATFHEWSMETMNKVSKFHKASSTVKLTYVFNPA